MSIDEQPTIKHLQQQLYGMELLLKANKWLLSIGLGSKQIADIETQYQQLKQQLEERIEYQKSFNEFFSDDGWLAHDSINSDVLKQAVDTFNSSGKDQAIDILVDYYSAEQVAKRKSLFNHVTEFRTRKKFIDFALEDHSAGRYYSAVPLLLMVIDGAMNDAHGQGFHATDIQLDVWDSLMVADGAIYKVKGIFQKGRKKTRTETIEMPYRHGILHGMDLGYDNPIVTAKCWCFLFVVRDWILAKQSESARKDAFEKQTKTPSLSAIVKQLNSTKRLREATEAWTARSIEAEYIELLNESVEPEEGTPEATVLQFLELWSKRNYGYMSQYFWKGKHVREVRALFEDVDVSNYSLTQIVDKAPAISEVDVEIQTNSRINHWQFRLIREDEQGKPVPTNLPDGRWQIVWLNPTKLKSNHL